MEGPNESEEDKYEEVKEPNPENFNGHALSRSKSKKKMTSFKMKVVPLKLAPPPEDRPVPEPPRADNPDDPDMNPLPNHPTHMHNDFFYDHPSRRRNNINSAKQDPSMEDPPGFWPADDLPLPFDNNPPNCPQIGKKRPGKYYIF